MDAHWDIASSDAPLAKIRTIITINSFEVSSFLKEVFLCSLVDSTIGTVAKLNILKAASLNL
jgi:hypothetical protein